MHTATVAVTIPAFAPVAAVIDTAPVTGNGPLAERFNSERHGLTVRNLRAEAECYAAASDRALTVVWNREQAANDAAACCEYCARRANRKLADAEALLDAITRKWDAVIILAARLDVRGVRSVANLVGLEY